MQVFLSNLLKEDSSAYKDIAEVVIEHNSISHEPSFLNAAAILTLGIVPYVGTYEDETIVRTFNLEAAVESSRGGGDG